MTIKLIELAILLILSVINDCLTSRIDNKLIALFAAIGAVTNLIHAGPGGLFFSAAGIILPILLLFWLFMLRMLGAGDIKLFCAIGSIAGPGFTAGCIAWSFIAGGLSSLVLMAVRKNAPERFRHLGSYLKACILSGSLLEYSSHDDKKCGARFRFSPSIAAGAAIQAMLPITPFY